MRGKRLNGTANSAKLTKLSANTRYHICVIGSGNWLSESVVNALQKIHFNDSFVMQRDESNQQQHGQWYEATGEQRHELDLDLETAAAAASAALQPQQQQALIENTVVTDSVLRELLKNSHVSACTDVQTLDSTPSLIADENGLASNGFIHSILTRRLGLIVGCCLGIIVFIVMISVLSYVKLKKQRLENAKRQAAMPPEYISYRHFSIPNEELRAGTVMSSVPSGISAHISGTSLSTSTNTATATTPLGGVLPLKAITEDNGLAVGHEASTAVAADFAHGSDVGVTTNNHNHQQPLQHHQPHNNHVGGNGSVMGYMAAGVVLATNHLNTR